MKKTPKNFAIWTALNSGECNFFSSVPSYYGGNAYTERQKKQAEHFCEKYYINKNLWSYFDDAAILKTIKVIGIDFDECTMPVSDRAAAFQGTFAEATYTDIVIGTLVLKDGQRIDYYARCKLNMDQFKAMQEFFEEAE